MRPSHQIDTTVLQPLLLDIQTTADEANLTLRIPENLAYFDGHFDEIAVVPGVVQIQWAVHYARQYLGLDKTFSHMDAVKFKELLLPGQQLQLELRYLQPACKLEFCYRAADGEFSSGRIYFHDHSL